MIRNGPIEKNGRKRRFALLGNRTSNRRVRPPADPPRAILPDEKTAPMRTGRRLRTCIKVVGAVVAAATLGGGAALAHRFITRSPKFAVREVRVSGTHRVSADALRARSGVVIGANLFGADLDGARRELLGDPWVREAKVRRELPDVVALDVVEREPTCVVAFGGLYLTDARGEAFKRATPDEAAGLPVVTGIARDAYVDDREAAQALVRQALAGLAAWRERPGRPSIGEVHVDAAAGVTLYTVKELVAIRIGLPDGPEAWRARLTRYDTVAAALRDAGERPRAILVDQRARPDRVTVRLASR